MLSKEEANQTAEVLIRSARELSGSKGRKGTLWLYRLYPELRYWEPLQRRAILRAAESAVTWSGPLLLMGMLGAASVGAATVAYVIGRATFSWIGPVAACVFISMEAIRWSLVRRRLLGMRLAGVQMPVG
jgi:hypothetical protein